MGISDKDHQEGLRAARAFAAYEIGDPSWADAIIDKYREAAGI